jgi:hypothetical protein
VAGDPGNETGMHKTHMVGGAPQFTGSESTIGRSCRSETEEWCRINKPLY